MNATIYAVVAVLSLDALPRLPRPPHPTPATRLKPYGVVVLLVTARRLVALCGRRVELANLGRQLHSYLERIDLFEVGGGWLAPTRGLDDGWDRIYQTPNLLELMAIEGPQDVVTAILGSSASFSLTGKKPRQPITYKQEESQRLPEEQAE